MASFLLNRVELDVIVTSFNQSIVEMSYGFKKEWARTLKLELGSTS